MQYRKYGRSDRKVSELGLGGHREGVETGDGLARQARFFAPAQERARVVGAAIDAGVTYFDTTFSCEIASLGESLRILKKRDGLFVSGMRVDFYSNFLAEGGDVRAYVRREVDKCLQAFGFDALDQFMLGAMESGDPLAAPPAVLDDALGELGRLREQGKLRYVGFSCHRLDYAARLLDRHPQFDAVMTPYNFANREAEKSLATSLAKTGAAWIGMKTLVWHIYGIPVTALRHLRPEALTGSLSSDVPLGRLAVAFVLANPRLTTCVPAMNTVAAVQENVAASGLPFGEREQAVLDAAGKAMVSADFVPLALGALHEHDGRTLSYAMALLKGKLGWETEPIDWSAPDAQAKAQRAAKALLERARGDGQWGKYVV